MKIVEMRGRSKSCNLVPTRTKPYREKQIVKSKTIPKRGAKSAEKNGSSRREIGRSDKDRGNQIGISR